MLIGLPAGRSTTSATTWAPSRLTSGTGSTTTPNTNPITPLIAITGHGLEVGADQRSSVRLALAIKDRALMRDLPGCKTARLSCLHCAHADDQLVVRIVWLELGALQVLDSQAMQESDRCQHVAVSLDADLLRGEDRFEEPASGE